MTQEVQKRLSVDVDSDDYDYLKKYCERERITISKFMGDVLAEMLEVVEDRETFLEVKDTFQRMRDGTEPTLTLDELVGSFFLQ